jgi:hypothetical protein
MGDTIRGDGVTPPRRSGADLDAALRAAGLPPLDDDLERDIAEAVALVEPIPSRQRPRFVSREEFAAGSRDALLPDLDAFRADQDAVADHGVTCPFDRW